jgi:hypothetical protein
MCPSWNAVALDPCGRSGGLLSGWNPDYAELSSLDTRAGIYLEGRVKQSATSVKMLNCYAPYKDKEFSGTLYFSLAFYMKKTLLLAEI